MAADTELPVGIAAPAPKLAGVAYAADVALAGRDVDPLRVGRDRAVGDERGTLGGGPRRKFPFVARSPAMEAIVLEDRAGDFLAASKELRALRREVSLLEI